MKDADPKSSTRDQSAMFTGEYGDFKANPKKPVIIWGHGWGQDHRAFNALMESLSHEADHIALDFPGFGQSPQPDDIWSTGDYARAVVDFIESDKRLESRTLFWAGHSFGGRVGLQLGIITPDLFAGFIMIASAGLKRKRPLPQAIKIWSKIRIFKLFKFLIHFGVSKDWVMRAFTSGDYQSAGAMRQIFVKTVNEDLTEQASKMPRPALLMYGQNDDETPPELGERLSNLITDSKLIVLDGLDHYSILTDGRHILAKMIGDFIAEHHKTKS